MKTILSLCDFTGNWSRPYPESGLEVIKAVEPIHGDLTTRLGSRRKVARSATPEGFARAFFEANP